MILHGRLRWLVALSIIFLISVIYTFNDNLPRFAISTPASWRDVSSSFHNAGKASVTAQSSPTVELTIAPSPTAQQPTTTSTSHSRVLVIARKKSEDDEWVSTELADLPNFDAAIYVVDDRHAPLHVPRNKGHEVMVYLTYIIDNYNSLSDVTMFMHAHLSSWHNNDLLGKSAAEMVKRLSSERVIREGYMNMRCHWDPGCPDHLHPLSESAINNTEQPEEIVFAQAWGELFPEKPVPAVLSQPCCAQFAVSRDRIRSIPHERYVFYRKWLLKTKLPDKLSGRIWEYLWQVIFAGVDEFCPKENICYCDGYGVCFGGETEFAHWFSMRKDREKYEKKRDELKGKKVEGNQRALDELAAKVIDLSQQMDKLKEEALANGMNPEFRAREVGRKWSPGDGF